MKYNAIKLPVTAFLKCLGLFMASLGIVAVLFLHIPQVQNTLFSKILKHLSQQTQYHFQHQQFRVTWGYKILLQDLAISDANNQPVCNIPYLRCSINPFSLFYKQNLIINDLHIREGSIHCVQKEGEQVYNIHHLITKLVGGDSTSTTFNYQGITISKALLDNCSFVLEDQTQPYRPSFDPYHIQIESMTIALSDFHTQGESWTGNIEKFECYDVIKDLNIQQLQAKFTITPTIYLLQHLYITTPYSHLRGNFSLIHQGVEKLMIDPYHAQITADIEALQLDTQELAPICLYLKEYNTIYKLKGKVTGTFDDLVIPTYEIAFGESYLKGAINILQLSKFDAMHFSVVIDEGRLHATDILPYVSESHTEILQKFQYCYLKTNCTGTLQYMVIQGQFDTNIGKIATDIIIKKDLPNTSIAYQGEIKTIDFNFGTLLNLPQLGEATLLATIKGEGSDLSTARAHVTANVQKLTLLSYEYQNICAEGDLGNMFFVGKLSIHDPHCVSLLDLQVNSLVANKAISVRGTLEVLQVDKLGLISQPLQVSSKIDIALEGDIWTALAGKATLRDIHLLFKNRSLHCKEIAITTSQEFDKQSFNLASDFLDIQVEGSQTYTTWLHDLQALLSNYKNQLHCSNTLYTASSDQYTHIPYALKYQMNFKHPESFLHFLGVNIGITSNENFRGSFVQNKDEVQFELHTSELGSLQFAKNRFNKSQLDITIHHHKKDATLLAASQLKVQQYQWQNGIALNQLLLDINWINDTIQLHSTLGDNTSSLQYDLYATAHLSKPNWQIQFQDSSIRLENEVWVLDPKNTIEISPLTIVCQNISFSCQEQEIALVANLSNSAIGHVDIVLKNFLINKLSPIVDKNIGGIIQGKFNITNRLNQPNIQGELYIQDASIQALNLGNLHIQTSWIDNKQCMQVTGSLTKDRQTIINLDGFYMPYHPTQQLDLIANCFQTPLAYLEPFIDVIVSQLKGELSGKIFIRGTCEKPFIKGNGTLQYLILQFKHLKAIYNGEGTIHFLGNTIHVDKLHLIDQYTGYSDFSGTVACHTLDNIQLDLKGKMHQIEVLNTEQEDNMYFYGKGVISGDIHLKGLVQYLDIYASGITKAGTRLTIPILKLNKIAEQEDFIRFVTLPNSQDKNPSVQSNVTIFPLASLNLHLNLEITPEAYTKILFAGKNKDTIQAKGKGKLTIQSNIRNTFHISGSYELVEGDYNFTVYEIIKRKFQIIPGSTITWVNNLDDGMLQLKATYDQWTSLMPLLDNRGKKNNLDNSKKKYPIKIGLSITGMLAVPNINFDIQFLQLPQDPILQESILAFQEKLATDIDYLKTQVFSLIMFKKFATNWQNLQPDNTLQQSLGELFSRQLNNLAEYISEDLEIETDIDFGAITQPTEGLVNKKDMHLPIKLSYNLWRDRLVMSVESKIKPYDDQEIYFKDILDTWSIAYNLTNDKRIWIKFRGYPTGKRLNMNVSNPTIGGISFIYQNSFNNWKNFFWKSN